MPEYVIYCSYEDDLGGGYHVLAYHDLSGTYKHLCSVDGRESAEKIMKALNKEKKNEDA